MSTRSLSLRLAGGARLGVPECKPLRPGQYQSLSATHVTVQASPASGCQPGTVAVSHGDQDWQEYKTRTQAASELMTQARNFKLNSDRHKPDFAEYATNRNTLRFS
eukprot:2395196-Rhodomonas_salina.2